jgi:hypothetical protein
MFSVVDPDPVTPETFSRIRKKHSGSEQMRIRNELEGETVLYSEKLIKIFTISEQNAH